MLGEFGHLAVGYERRLRYRLQQPDAFQSPASGERHIDLSVRESPVGLYQHLVESQALALVYGYRPRQPQRVLRERAFLVLGYLAGVLVQGVFHVVPRHDRHTDQLAVLYAAYQNLLSINAFHHADLAVEELVLHSVVFAEHHLRAFLQNKVLFNRIQRLVENAVYLRLEHEFLAFQLTELLLVYLVSRSVVSAQSYGAVVVLRLFIDS